MKELTFVLERNGSIFNMASTTDEDVSSSHKGKKFARLLSHLNFDKKCSLELYIIRIKEHISPLQRNAFLFFS